MRMTVVTYRHHGLRDCLSIFQTEGYVRLSCAAKSNLVIMTERVLDTAAWGMCNRGQNCGKCNRPKECCTGQMVFVGSSRKFRVRPNEVETEWYKCVWCCSHCSTREIWIELMNFIVRKRPWKMYIGATGSRKTMTKFIFAQCHLLGEVNFVEVQVWSPRYFIISVVVDSFTYSLYRIPKGKTLRRSLHIAEGLLTTEKLQLSFANEILIFFKQTLQAFIVSGTRRKSLISLPISPPHFWQQTGFRYQGVNNKVCGGTGYDFWFCSNNNPMIFGLIDDSLHRYFFFSAQDFALRSTFWSM